MGWKQGHPTAVPTAWPCTHLSPSLHPSLMGEGTEIPLMHSSTQINWDLRPRATGILAGFRQLGSPHQPAPPCAGVRVRTGSSSEVDWDKDLDRPCSAALLPQTRTPKAHSLDSWDFLPPASTAPGSACLHPLQKHLTWSLIHLQLAGIAALERRGEIKRQWLKC